ncbi:CehA/McbA family metallohydrolase [Kitasatospora purpeofusca]|uniref:CehA/McbA family metallohydrolase n=1 Tax=Kitasatospora purpeofusca TaxID=67352 RepID=UPI0022566D13|nr:CehA/McbA family metallohydrolase [Kitasatospora purpeofusca]MCX4758850.1 CehA/McbA family metallohydrolase [Kitasatospora purpeofusca]WSR30725.1 CehA/McbA family metallohydrolase [Kitasatospora purpeofusca]WSR38964.1 CehA/McbA family metallohydrolase [Kitasatospora purpeofusca]
MADDVHEERARPGRRGLLAAGAAGALGAVVAGTGTARAEGSQGAAAPAAPQDRTITLTGKLPTGAPDFVYLPFDVPSGVRELAVSYRYDRPTVPTGTPGNSCDIGLFDERGTELGGRGFRGWSGGFRTEFAVSRERATPGYLPGPVRPGRWNVVLGPYQIAPQGLEYRVDVTLRFGPAGGAFTPAYPPERARGRGRAWYRGDCHLHTVHSDGRREPAEVAAGARAAGLDFIVSTDHNTSSAHGVWGPLAGPDLLILPGEEVTTRNGHWLALGLRPGEFVDWRYRSRDEALPRFARQVKRQGGLVVPAHPFCPYVACQWKFGYEHADAVEVWNGPWTYDDESAVDGWDAQLAVALRDGRSWLPAIGNSDAHSAPQVIGSPHTVVLAEDLSRDDILDGLRSGRSWLAESAAVRLEFTATGNGRQAGIGEELAVPADAPVDVRLDVSGVPNGTVRFLTDEGQLHQESLPAEGAGTVVWRTTASLAAFVRAEVRHPRADGTPGRGNAMGPDLPWGPMAALTNPIVLRARA